MDKDIFDNQLLYYGFDDFFNKRIGIKSIFHLKSREEQYIYKLYVYSRPFINDNTKDWIWDYLQGDVTELQFTLYHIDYKRKRKH